MRVGEAKTVLTLFSVTEEAAAAKKKKWRKKENQIWFMCRYLESTMEMWNFCANPIVELLGIKFNCDEFVDSRAQWSLTSGLTMPLDMPNVSRDAMQLIFQWSRKKKFIILQLFNFLYRKICVKKFWTFFFLFLVHEVMISAAWVLSWIVTFLSSSKFSANNFHLLLLLASLRS